jgi:hypothetical protein
MLLSMNIRHFPVSVWLLAFGTGVALFIGAFAQFDPAIPSHPDLASLANPPPLTQDDPPVEATGEPTLPDDLSPGLSEIVKLAQAHMDESVILAYIKNSGLVFSPSADEILYLSGLGLSQDVIGALLKTAPPAATPQTSQETVAVASVPMNPPPSAIQPEQDSSTDAFYNDLAPYGTWSQQADYGLCWQPAAETTNPDWRPYVDAGQWLYSDSGWYWQSDYPWGWAVFHYGGWAKVPRQGWVWVPGQQWAPAWVAWRSTSFYIGWAPLPPGVSLNVLAQLTYHSRPAKPNATFGLPSSAYTFVSVGNLTSRNLSRRVAPASQINTLAQNSVVIDSYAIVNHKIFNRGASPEAVAAAAHKAVREVTLRTVSSPEDGDLLIDRKTWAVYRPVVSSADASPSAQFVADKPRVPAPVEKLPAQEPRALAENDFAGAPVMPVSSISGDASVQLPPLHYPTPDSPTAVRHPRQEVNIASAPRIEQFSPPARQAEPPRIAVENRPAPVEPPRPAAVPAASSSSSGSSKSGK